MYFWGGFIDLHEKLRLDCTEMLLLPEGLCKKLLDEDHEMQLWDGAGEELVVWWRKFGDLTPVWVSAAVS